MLFTSFLHCIIIVNDSLLQVKFYSTVMLQFSTDIGIVFL